jgi:hypothetical protein
MQDDISLFVYMPIIYFMYGMTFFMMGITIAVEQIIGSLGGNIRRFIGSPVGFLSLFGLAHGLAELIEMTAILYGNPQFTLKAVELFFFSLSFYFLFKFAVTYIYEKSPDRNAPPHFSLSIVPVAVFILWAAGTAALLVYRGGIAGISQGEVLSRYLIGFPGSLAASVAFFMNRTTVTSRQRGYLLLAAAGFAAYAVLAGLVVPRTSLQYPLVLDYDRFYAITHMPIQLIRSVCAVIITFALLRFFTLSKEFSTIRFKSTIHILFTIVLPASIIVSLVCYMIAGAFLSLSSREIDRKTLLAADHAVLFLSEVEEKARYHLLSAKMAPPGLKGDLLVSLVRDNKEINGLIVADEKGAVLSIERDPRDSASIHQEYHGGPARLANFLEISARAVHTGKFSITGYDRKNLSMEIPLEGKSMRILIALDKLYRTVSALEIEKGWHALLVNDAGMVMMPFGGRHHGEAAVMKALAREEYSYVLHHEEGVDYYAIGKRIMPSGLSAVIEIPLREMVSPIFTVFKGLLLGFLFIYMAAVAFAIILADKIVKPINLIARRVKLIGSGDFEQHLEVKTGDELQTLSEEIEKMAQSLSEQKKTEERMMHTEKIASLGRLTAGISHEINNPLGIILGYCQVLLRELEPGSRHVADLKMRPIRSSANE